MVKPISWNVNELGARVGKSFLDFSQTVDVDVFRIQKSKLQEGQIELDLLGCHRYWNYARKRGYSDTAVFARERPIFVIYGISMEEHDTEGRAITAKFSEYYVVICYTPDSQNGFAKLDYRMKWGGDFLLYLRGLEKNRLVIPRGNLDVAHEEIDLKNPKTNRKDASFTDEERERFTDLLSTGFMDTLRYFYLDMKDIYPWWSYRFSARTKNVGQRIDYFYVSGSLKDRLASASIHTDIMGSDHYLVELVVN